MNEFGNFAAPAVNEYGIALDTLRYQLTDIDWLILNGQRHAPQRRLTATSCAELLGSDSYRTGNLRYGTLGRKLCAALPGWAPPVRPNSSPQYWTALATGEVLNRELIWTMHAALAVAIAEHDLGREGHARPGPRDGGA